MHPWGCGDGAALCSRVPPGRCPGFPWVPEARASARGAHWRSRPYRVASAPARAPDVAGGGASAGAILGGRGGGGGGRTEEAASGQAGEPQSARPASGLRPPRAFLAAAGCPPLARPPPSSLLLRFRAVNRNSVFQSALCTHSVRVVWVFLSPSS